jgi:hypothetical protein
MPRNPFIYAICFFLGYPKAYSVAQRHVFAAIATPQGFMPFHNFYMLRKSRSTKKALQRSSRCPGPGTIR